MATILTIKTFDIEIKNSTQSWVCKGSVFCSENRPKFNTILFEIVQ